MQSRFTANARAWGLTQAQALLIAAVPILIVLSLTASVPFFEFFYWLTAEDSVIEWG